MLQTYLVPRYPQSLFYTIIASFLQKHAPNKTKQSIKRFSGIVATLVDDFATSSWSVRHSPVFRCYEV